MAEALGATVFVKNVHRALFVAVPCRSQIIREYGIRLRIFLDLLGRMQAVSFHVLSPDSAHKIKPLHL